jgi:hypothetical protein
VASSKAVEQAARKLYGLPPGEFTGARDARVKELRKEGDREAADGVKALRKPTVAAWALNQLARTRAKEVERLIAAGEQLRSAQEELLGGGDRSAFQEAAAAERELVAELSADATTLASEAGERGGGLREKVAETLHAAALDGDTAEELRAGRLTREREAIGGFGAPGGGPAPAPPKRPAKARSTKAAPGSAGRSEGGAAADTGEAARSKPRAGGKQREEAERRQRLAAARTDERHARRELDAAAKAVRHAQERADAAKTHAEEAAERAKTTAERLREAKRAESAARKAHARAAKALESADGDS